MKVGTRKRTGVYFFHLTSAPFQATLPVHIKRDPSLSLLRQPSRFELELWLSPCNPSIRLFAFLLYHASITLSLLVLTSQRLFCHLFRDANILYTYVGQAQCCQQNASVLGLSACNVYADRNGESNSESAAT